MTDSQRRSAYRMILESKCQLIIGTRTALFAPAADLGLVIIDAEHDGGYKSGQTPRYHARLVAEILCRFSAAKLVLCSPCPSLESWQHAVALSPAAKEPRFQLARTAAISGSTAPTTAVTDLASEPYSRLYPLSAPLLAALNERLRLHEQAVLLLNRRGFATALLCLECRQTVNAPASPLPLVLHTNGGKATLVDHHTGRTMAAPARCPHCDSVQLKAVGAGTERVEALLKRLFPTARILRLDRETLHTAREAGRMFTAIESGDVDIVIGTQPVLRALASPLVTLAAMLVADVGLSQADFRAGERVFQTMVCLLTGIRKGRPTEVILQTFRPQAPEMIHAAKADTEGYLSWELQGRTAGGFPPATQIIALIVRGPSSEHRARTLAREARLTAPADCTVTLVRPLANRSSWRVLLRGGAPRSILKNLHLEGVIVDVDPMEFA